MLMVSLFYVSCGRQRPQPVATTGGEQHGPVTAAERSLVNRIIDVSAVLQSVYHDPAALAEVNAAIASGYYHDERVLLADLLYTEESSLYHFMTQRIDESNTPGEGTPRGTVQKQFRQAAHEVLGTHWRETILCLVADVGTFARGVI